MFSVFTSTEMSFSLWMKFRSLAYAQKPRNWYPKNNSTFTVIHWCLLEFLVLPHELVSLTTNTLPYSFFLIVFKTNSGLFVLVLLIFFEFWIIVQITNMLYIQWHFNSWNQSLCMVKAFVLFCLHSMEMNLKHLKQFGLQRFPFCSGFSFHRFPWIPLYQRYVPVHSD